SGSADSGTSCAAPGSAWGARNWHAPARARSEASGLPSRCAHVRTHRPMDTYEPIAQFTALVETQAGLAGPNYRADIRTIDVVGDAGVAVLVETDYFGCDFVDFFTVARIDGRWWITNKTYAHTGGTPPAS